MKNSSNRNYENANKRIFPGNGQYDIPEILPQEYTGCDFIGFNYMAKCKARNKTGIHFYLDDYQFVRLWNMPDYYLPMLQQFEYVLTPDFSLYRDFPLALQIYNHYRKHWIGAYLQQNGVKVIPTISWSDERSFEWCFDGEPVRSAVSVSAVGTQMNKTAKKYFLEGYKKMQERLQPKTIIFYGSVPEECTGNIVRIPSFQEKFHKNGGEADGR